MRSGGTSTPQRSPPAPRSDTPHPMPSKKVHFSWRGDREAHPVSGLSRKQKGTKEHAGEEGGYAMGRRGWGCEVGGGGKRWGVRRGGGEAGGGLRPS